MNEAIEGFGLLHWITGTFIPNVVLPFALKILGILIVWAAGTKFIQFTRRFAARALEKGNAEKGVSTFLDNFIKLGLYGLLVIIILGMFGVEMASITAVIASAGVAVGLALQGSLSNLAGGVLILLLKPFEVGDYIIAAGLEGSVYEIQMFCTKLRTGDNRLIIIPNATLNNGTIVNVTAMDKRRLDILVGIGYDSDLKLAKTVLSDLVRLCPYTLPEEANNVFVDSLADSSVLLNVRVWVKTSDYFAAKTYLNEQIKLTLDKHHIEIPYNKLDVHIGQQPKM